MAGHIHFTEQSAPSSGSIGITFVFLGDKLPTYALSSMKLIPEFNGVEATLLCSRKVGRRIPDNLARVIPLEDFYSREKFLRVAKSIQSPIEFRDGFWHKTFERFFVLDQFSSAFAEPQLFHAELDQVFFRVEALITALGKRPERGLFFPFHTANTGIASVFFSNSPESLRSLVDHVTNGKTYPDEMHVLADWAKNNPLRFHGLPTLADYQNGQLTRCIDLQISAFSGLPGAVDGVQIGQWVAGIDPRNLPITELSRNKFSNSPDPHLLANASLEKLTFTLSEQNLLEVRQGESTIPLLLFNLHIHSKIHTYLARRRGRVKALINRSNRRTRSLVPGAQVRTIILATEKVAKLLLKRLSKRVKRIKAVLIHQRVKLIRFIGWRPSSRPYLSGDGFRAMADCVWEKKNREPIDSLPEGSVVFCEGDLSLELAEVARNTPAKNLTLILGNSDTNHYHLERSLTEGGPFKQVFAQNLGNKLSNATPLPIGLENRFRHHHGIPRNYSKARANLRTKKPRIMWSFDTNTNPQERLKAEEALRRVGVADNVGWLSPSNHLHTLSLYAAVACPPGNGLDTHRVWEALYLKTIPIVTRSYSYEYFESLGVPLWIVDDFCDLENVQEADVSGVWGSLESRFNSPALWFPYWESLIRNRKTGK